MKLINNFWLNLIIDCDKFSNPRPISYTFFILFFSLVFAFLSILNSFSISYICLISFFSSISQLFSNIKTLGYIKNSINLAKKIIESSMDNTKKNKLIFLNSNILKECMSLFIFVNFYLIIPYSGTLKTFFFNSSNIINFFN